MMFFLPTDIFYVFFRSSFEVFEAYITLPLSLDLDTPLRTCCKFLSPNPQIEPNS